jgi:hypothetical protein
MNINNPFRASPDAELGERLRAWLDGPDPEGFQRRLAVRLGDLPELDTQWDVLERWARSRILTAAMVAAFLLGFALLSSWRAQRTAPQMVATLPATMLLGSDTAPNPLIFSVLLEER